MYNSKYKELGYYVKYRLKTEHNDLQISYTTIPFTIENRKTIQNLFWLLRRPFLDLWKKNVVPFLSNIGF